MPTYTYRCGTCGHQFDVFQHFTDDALTECPECGKETLHKVYSPVGIVFKGSGFYSTDNRSPSGQTMDPHEHGSASGEGSHESSEKTTETSSSGTGSESSAPASASSESSTSADS